MMQPTWQTDDGRVKLWLANCLDVLPTLDAGSVDCVVTDPPYGHNNNNNGDLIHRWEAALGRLPGGENPPPARAIDNDGQEANELYRQMLPHAFRLLKPGCCCCCCCGGGGPDPQFAHWSLWMDEVFNFKQMVVWDKGPMGMGWHYRRSYETILVGEKGGAACRWFGGNNKENIIRPGAHGIRKIIPSEDEHPCAKPVELYQHFIGLHSRPGDAVLDPFMGEAPCGIACVNSGRLFLGCETDKKHFDKAVERIIAELERMPLFEAKPKYRQRELVD